MRQPKLDALILSASTGNGHLSAGRALEGELKSRGWRAEHVDALDWVTKGFQKWYRGGYETLVRRKPEMWGTLYKRSDNRGFTYGFQTMLDTHFVKRIKPLLEETQPRWVLCTHSLVQPRLDRLRPVAPGMRMGIVVTDLYPHRMWLRGNPDHFFVPSEWSKEKLIERYPASEGHIDVTGIPIDPMFGAPHEPSEDGRVRALITAGGIGAGPLGPLLAEIKRLGVEADLRVVCGRSDAAQRVAEAAAKESPSIQVFGHVSQPQMAELMRTSDVILAKPGGLTTFEALAAGLPFIVAEPFLIPGQEEGNGEFIEAEGIGRRAETVEGAAKLLAEFVDSPDDREKMRANALKHARPDAVKRIADRLEEL